MTPNAVRINEINTQLQSLRTNLDNEVSDRKKVRYRLEELRRADSKLDLLLDRYSDFPDKYRNLHAPAPHLSLRGSRREAIEERLSSICDSLKTQQRRHKEHSQTIKNRIRTDENLEDQHSTAINSINTQISDLEKERRMLQTMEANLIL